MRRNLTSVRGWRGFGGGVVLGCVLGVVAMLALGRGRTADSQTRDETREVAPNRASLESAASEPGAGNADSDRSAVARSRSAETPDRRGVDSIPDAVIPDAMIRGHLVARDGRPIEGARILAIPTRIAAMENPSLGTSVATHATPEEGGSIALTRHGGAFGVFGLESGVDYALFVDVPDSRRLVDLSGPVRAGMCTAPASRVELVDPTHLLIVSLDLDSELSKIVESNPGAFAQGQLLRPPPFSAIARFTVPLRSELVCRVPADLPLTLQLRGDEIRPWEMHDVIVAAAEAEHFSRANLSGWGQGNAVFLTLRDDMGNPLERAAITLVPGRDVPPIPYTSSPRVTETRQIVLDRGGYSEANVAPGSCTVFVTPPTASGLAPLRATIEVAASGETRAEWSLVRGGNFRIDLPAAVHSQLKSIAVVLDRPGDPSAPIWLTDENGGGSSSGSYVPASPTVMFASHPVPPGNYAVIFVMAGEGPARVPFRVVAGEVVPVALR